MTNELPPQYSPKDTEEKIYTMWEASGFFAPEAHRPRADNPNSKKTFCITVPPPNITGSLHMGHALNATIQDIIIRKKRMEGFKTLWIAGTDHAGIATQNVVEKELKKEGLTRHDLGQEKLIERIWQWKEKYGGIILGQFKKLGASMDWSRTRFTMDPEYQEAVKAAFTHYHKKGWIYQARRVVNWCIRCQTSLSDLELEHKETDTTLYYINYPRTDGGGMITVATTRPETMLGDTAIAVNPKDLRYKNLIGKEVLLPIKNRKILIIADRAIDQNFGTGAVKVTPAHDLLDAEIGERHKLDAPQMIDSLGRMTEEAGPPYAGLKIIECRAKIIEELKQKNLLEREESYHHNVSICYRCGTTIEPLPSTQWFVKMSILAKRAIQAVKSGKIKFHPKRWEKVYLDWLKNIRDWTISRQIWWGHKIPIEGVDDVLDTWFSSALWPFATLGWPKQTDDLKTFYPTQILSTDRDIINLWVARMVYSGLEFMKKPPFKDIIIHATVRTKDGQRMSKSKGNVVNPLDFVEKFGADATRFGLIWQDMGTQDIKWSEEHVLAGKKFCNKLWNASRFVLSQLPTGTQRVAKKPKPRTADDKKILTACARIEKETTHKIDRFEFGQALHGLYDFFWHEFCDRYIEVAKEQILEPGIAESTQKILLYVLTQSLKLFHPFVPFITEEIWTHVPSENKQRLVVEAWPQ